MKKYLLVTAAALAVLGATNAFAEEPQLIPDCYADGQSQSEFHDCVQRNWASGGTAAVASRSESSQAPAIEDESQQTPDGDQSPPAGMWEREHTKVAAGTRTSDSYARLSEPRQGAYAPPGDWDANNGRSDTDGPDWGPPPDEGYGPPESGPPPDDDWDDRPMPPPDGAYY